MSLLAAIAWTLLALAAAFALTAAVVLSLGGPVS